MFSLGSFLLALVGVVLIHLGATMTVRFLGLSRADSGSRTADSPVGVIQAGLIPTRQGLAAAIATFVAGALAGIWLVIRLQSVPLLLIGLAGVLCAYLYSGIPLRLGSQGYAELLNGLAFGPVIGLGAYAVQAPLWDTTALLASIPPRRAGRGAPPDHRAAEL